GESLTIKYDPNGKELWEATLGPSDTIGGITIVAANGVDVGVDATGNVYVLSSVRENPSQATDQNLAFATAKYSPDGTRQWIDFFGGQSATISTPVKLAVGSNVYVTAQSATNIGTSSQTNDAVTIKYDLNGNQIWLKDVPGSPTTSNMNPQSLALDGAENV